MKKFLIILGLIVLITVLGVARKRALQNADSVPGFQDTGTVTEKKSPGIQTNQDQSDEPEQEIPPLFTLGAGDYTFSLMHDQLKRSYLVHVPGKYVTAKAVPMVIAMHGGSGQAPAMALLTQIEPVADREGFIVVYPNGSGPTILGRVIGSWNAGECCPEASKKGVDDVGFLKAMIADTEQKFNIDRKRVYATGMSNGSMMSFRLACGLSDTIAAIAPVGAQGGITDCAPKRPVPVLYFHGTKDPCSPYEGGLAGGCLATIFKDVFFISLPEYHWQVPSVPDFIDTIRTLYASNGKPVVTYSKGSVTCEGTDVGTGREVTLCTIEGGGHSWPGGTRGDICNGKETSRVCLAASERLGITTMDILASEEMWKFFKAHPMP